MSEIRQQLEAIPEVARVAIDKVEIHGENATEVVATLHDGRTVTGTFTTEDKAAFGGVQFSSRKNVGALMSSKIQSVVTGSVDE